MISDLLTMNSRRSELELRMYTIYVQLHILPQPLAGGAMVTLLEDIGARSGLQLNNAAPQAVPCNNAGIVTQLHVHVYSACSVMYKGV